MEKGQARQLAKCSGVVGPTNPSASLHTCPHDPSLLVQRWHFLVFV